MDTCDVAIVGAGPYGLAAASHLQHVKGLDVRLFGRPMTFWERRPAHRVLQATGYDGVRRRVEVTAYPLFGTTEEMHGVVAVFWETGG